MKPRHIHDFLPAILGRSGRIAPPGFPARLALAQERGSVRALSLDPHRTATPDRIYRVEVDPLTDDEQRAIDAIDRLRQANLDTTIPAASILIGTLAIIAILLRAAAHAGWL